MLRVTECYAPRVGLYSTVRWRLFRRFLHKGDTGPPCPSVGCHARQTGRRFAPAPGRSADMCCCALKGFSCDRMWCNDVSTVYSNLRRGSYRVGPSEAWFLRVPARVMLGHFGAMSRFLTQGSGMAHLTRSDMLFISGWPLLPSGIWMALAPTWGPFHAVYRCDILEILCFWS